MTEEAGRRLLTRISAERDSGVLERLITAVVRLDAREGGARVREALAGSDAEKRAFAESVIVRLRSG
jgi:hypothetical protein